MQIIDAEYVVVGEAQPPRRLVKSWPLLIWKLALLMFLGLSF